MHFEKLNYSFANETTEIELAGLPENVRSVFCIAGSGSRFTPLLTKNPEKIDVVDSSLSQLYIAELRYQAIQKLSYENYLQLLGYQKADSQLRIDLLEDLELSSDQNHFWLNINTKWQARGFIFIGQWEKKLQILRKIFYIFHFKNMNSVFSSKMKFPEKSWNFFCKVLLTEKVVRKLLYSDQSKYNLEKSFGQFIHDHFLTQIKKNRLNTEFFLQFLFCNELISSEAWPLEAQEDTFKKMKNAKTKVYFVHKKINDINMQGYDFYSLSDCFSYLSDVDSQKIINQLLSNKNQFSGVLRFFMYKPKLNFQTIQCSENDYSDLEKVPIYQITYFKK
jgi:S-adenosylmethionine:diacylglycerol 3-amino-3-carboxypropyl transferase